MDSAGCGQYPVMEYYEHDSENVYSKQNLRLLVDGASEDSCKKPKQKKN